MNCMDMLRKHSVFWSKLGFCYDPPRIGKDGKPIVFFNNWDQVKKYHQDFYQAGIRIHSSILFSGWLGVDKYDYELTDRVLEAIFSCGDDLLYIPRIKLNVPLEWSLENPEELCVYYDGPRNVESIRALVGTPKHDLLGYQSAKGYYTAGGWQDDRANVDGVISNQSFSSCKWLADAGKTLQHLIRHLEDGPYGNRIPAYHIAYGVSGESCVWGRCNIHNSADYGISNRRMFFDWGMQKYGSLQELRRIWRQENLLRDNVLMPSPDQKEGTIRTLDDFFRAAAEDQICTDYDCFTADSNVHALEHFGKIVKEETSGKPVGAFYGYFLEVARSTYTGYNALERVLNSPCIDFLAAPKREGGGVMCPSQSVNRKKLWMDELDNRTCLARGTGFEYKSSDFDETRNIMWREFAKNMSHNSNFWWMDLGGGWYDSPVLLREICRIERMAKELRKTPGHSISEILVVVDEGAFHRHKTSYYLHRCLFSSVIDAMNRIGAPWDLYRMNDLAELDLTRYKVIVFANPFELEKYDFAQQIEPRIPAETILVWNYAPNYIRSAETGVTGTEMFLERKLTEIIPEYGKAIMPTGKFEGTSPLVWPDHSPSDACPKADNCPVLATDECDEMLARFPGGKAAVVEWIRNGRRNIFCAAPLLAASHYRQIIRDAGAKLYAKENVLVYADSRFLFYFAWDTCSFQCDVSGRAHTFEAVREEDVSGDFVLSLKQYESRFYTEK